MSYDKDFNNLNIKLETPDIPDPLSDDILSKFDSEGHLGMMSNGGIYPQEHLFIGNVEDNEPDDTIILHMEIREPLSALRALLEDKVGLNLKNYKFWLQDAQELEPHKNLVDQCVKGEGLVQINAQIQTISGRINIVDVLKPTEAALAVLGGQNDYQDIKVMDENDDSVSSTFDESNSNAVSGDDEQTEKRKPDHVVNWVLDTKFKKDQARLKIPEDPIDWTNAQVRHWLQWAVRQFNLTQIKLHEWDVSGKELCAISLEEFQTKVPHDPGNVFWTHLELLRKCKFVAVIHKEMENAEHDGTNAMPRRNSKLIKKQSVSNLLKPYTGSFGQWEMRGNPSGNNGQIQLWQFLLDILTDKDYKSIIQWIGGDGEFKLTDPERVAQLWGERKNKPAMNYEKLSRALRYYYDGDLISKVHGKRFVYKFVCDLKQLIGYNAKELSDLVNQCEMDSDYSKSSMF